MAGGMEELVSSIANPSGCAWRLCGALPGPLSLPLTWISPAGFGWGSKAVLRPCRVPTTAEGAPHSQARSF